jgi:hypothetical protein
VTRLRRLLRSYRLVDADDGRPPLRQVIRWLTVQQAFTITRLPRWRVRLQTAIRGSALRLEVGPRVVGGTGGLKLEVEEDILARHGSTVGWSFIDFIRGAA